MCGNMDMARNDSVRILNLYIQCRSRTRERATGCPIGGNRIGDRARFKLKLNQHLSAHAQYLHFFGSH